MGWRDQTSGGWAGKTGAPETWQQFDALPVGVKRLFWAAPYDYTALPAWRAWMMGQDMRAFVAATLCSIEAEVQRESARLYGEAQEGWL